MVTTPTTPPHDAPAECALLGAMILDPTIIPTIATIVAPDAFFDSTRAVVFSELSEMARSGIAIDIVTLAPRRRLQDALGDRAAQYLYDLTTVSPGPAAAAYYAKRVADRARVRRIMQQAEQIAWEAAQWGDESPDLLANKAVERLSAAGRSALGSKDVHLADAEEQVFSAIESGLPESLPTGFRALDETIVGLPRQGVVTVMSTPNAGKTTLCLCVLVQMARMHQLGVRVFSYEQSPKRIAATLLSGAASLPVHRWLNSGTRPPLDQYEAMRGAQARHRELDFAMVEDSLNASEIYTRCAAYSRQGVGAVMIDYLQDLPPLPGFLDHTARTKESMRLLACIARDFPMLVVVVSQLTADASRENRAPRKGDGIGAAEIEQRSDVMLGLWRPNLGTPFVDNGREGFERAAALGRWREEQGETQVHILKSKYTGRGMAKMHFDGDKMQFREE